jgi:hypothetical protein
LIRRPLFLLLSLALVVAVVAGLAYRPATIAGVHADELASSLQDAGGGLSDARCDQRGDDNWRCETHLEARGHRAGVTYEVRVHGHFGCWHARRTDGLGPRGLAGCITVFDYL